MLPKYSRLSRLEFLVVFTRPDKKTHHSEYSVYFCTSPTFKVSVVVGKKVSKLAVKRNRFKREVYGAIQTFLSFNEDLFGHYIFILKPAFAKLTKTQRQSMIADLLAQNLKSR